MTVRNALFACALTVAGAAVVVGCGDKIKPDEQATMDPSTMSKDQLLMQGNNMVSKGQTMQSSAMQMGDGETVNGMDKEEMMKAGSESIHKGKAMIDRAEKM